MIRYNYYILNQISPSKNDRGTGSNLFADIKPNTSVDMIELPNARTKIASDFYKYLFMESGKNPFQMKRKELKLL